MKRRYSEPTQEDHDFAQLFGDYLENNPDKKVTSRKELEKIYLDAMQPYRKKGEQISFIFLTFLHFRHRNFVPK